MSTSGISIVVVTILSFPVPGSAELQPSWPKRALQRVSHASLEAITAPQTWACAAGAAVLYFGGLDQKVSDWASSATPIYGGTQRAKAGSDFFKDAAMIASIAAIGGEMIAGGVGSQALLRDALTLSAAALAIYATGEITAEVKTSSARLRPDRSNRRSFPSGHTSEATVLATLANRSIARMDLPTGLSLAAQGAVAATAVGTAWGRIEGAKHYPSDVLAGAALGYFFGTFLDALLKPMEKEPRVNVQPIVSPAHAAVNVSLTF